MNKQYILGESINIYKEKEIIDILNTQGIYQDEFDILKQSGIISTVLIYNEGYLTGIKEIDELNNIDIELNDKLRGLKHYEIPKNRINYILHSEIESNSYIGEAEFHDFSTPKSELIKSPFKVIGKLSKQESVFNWLPFEELYLTYPLFSGVIGCLYLDYSNPKNPEVYKKDYEIQYPHGEIGGSAPY